MRPEGGEREGKKRRGDDGGEQAAREMEKKSIIGAGVDVTRECHSLASTKYLAASPSMGVLPSPPPPSPPQFTKGL